MSQANGENTNALGNEQFYPYHSELLPYHRDNQTIAPVPMKQPWKYWESRHESTKNFNTTKTIQITTKWREYFKVCTRLEMHHIWKLENQWNSQDFRGYIDFSGITPANWRSRSAIVCFTCDRNIVIQGLYSLSRKTSYRQTSWSLEAARLDVAMAVSLWNLTGTSAALLPMYLPNFRAIGMV